MRKVYPTLYGISTVNYTELGDEVCGKGSGTVFKRVTNKGLTGKMHLLEGGRVVPSRGKSKWSGWCNGEHTRDVWGRWKGG